ncbi:PREDICTED: interleukin-20 receptor subunit beta-like isoform X2 [Cyprinodon variegatus]|uniref:interleukin-20 receptor subunit beta-like isoform X2 n=1 Tax=Cyprinodon variegatus TaxID=28743 RepID=UPI0007429739|nr:PREDICTED: interleukin-20 receptor subunit beta-like isoform X2 [Cyprinodon variegatus]
MPSRKTQELLIMVILLEFTKDIWMLPAPETVFMDSANMRHVLRWTHPEASCNTTVVYSVQYQGEFELVIKNGSWINAPDCQKIPHTDCDLTFDLGSDSDYNVRVRAQCGSRLSAWTKFPFNRNNVTPPVPDIKVTTAGDALLVSVRKFPLTAITKVVVWKKDGEQQASVSLMAADQEVLHFAALQEGAVYCVKAQVFLKSDMHSGYTDSYCVSITAPGAPAWKEPTAVTVTVVIMLGLLIGFFWSIVHCYPDSCQKYFQKATLPHFLRENFDFQTTMIPDPQEPCEETPHLLKAFTVEET